MERWAGRVALVTGASSGIGAAIALSLANAGMKVVGIARNVEPIEKLSKEVASSTGSITHLKCDLSKTEEIDVTFKTIKDKFGGVDVCINNAGFTYDKTLLDGTPTEWKSMMDVNVVALCHFSKLSTESLVDRGITDGQIINISSVTAYQTKCYSKVHFYAATKHAVKFITEGLRQEMIERDLKIRVASISPGIVKTEFGTRAFRRNSETMDLISKMPHLRPEDIANATLYILAAPPEVEVNDIIIRPQGQTV